MRQRENPINMGRIDFYREILFRLISTHTHTKTNNKAVQRTNQIHFSHIRMTFWYFSNDFTEICKNCFERGASYSFSPKSGIFAARSLSHFVISIARFARIFEQPNQKGLQYILLWMFCHCYPFETKKTMLNRIVNHIP